MPQVLTKILREGEVKRRHLLFLRQFPLDAEHMFWYSYIVNETNVRDRDKGDSYET